MNMIDIIVLKAVEQHPAALQFAHVDLKNKKEFIINVVKQYPLALEFASNELRGNDDIVMAAIKKDHNSIEFALSDAINNKEIIYAVFYGAIKKKKEYSTYLNFASDEIKKNKEEFIKEFIIDAFSNGQDDKYNYAGQSLKFAPTEIKNNVVFIDYLYESIKKKKKEKKRFSIY